VWLDGWVIRGRVKKRGGDFLMGEKCKIK
jgi:hypothetical protein